MSLSNSFICGFEKESGLKEWALAGMLAGTPAIAHAGGATSSAISHAAQAAQKQWGHLLAEKAPQAVKNIAHQAVTIGSGGAKTRIGLKNLRRLEIDRGPLQAAIEGGEAQAKYKLNKNLDLVAKSGPEKYIGFNYSKEF
jgi:hypothetical protein